MTETSETVSGINAVAAVLRYEPERVRALWIERYRCDRNPRLRALLSYAERHRIATESVTRAELDRRSGGVRHQGVVAELSGASHHFGERDLPEILATVAEPALLLVLDGVQDPHNLGACLRSAAAAGAQAVLVPGDRAVGLTATVRKVASGAAEVVPLIQVANLARTLRSLQKQGVWLVGAALEADTCLYQVDFSGPSAIVLGAEHKGLRRLTREICDVTAYIPIHPVVESLNVSVAAGVCLFEARRQRLA